MDFKRQPPDPDRVLVARLNGTAVRLARAGGSINEAVAELRDLASGRPDLLAEEAGLMLGSRSVDLDPGDGFVAAGLLMLAGADHNQIARWVEGDCDPVPAVPVGPGHRDGLSQPGLVSADGFGCLGDGA